MSDATMLAGCMEIETGMGEADNPFRDETHPVYVNIGKNTEALCDSTGDIHQEGLFFFKKPVDEEKIELDIFQVPIDNRGLYVSILQILFMEAVNGMSFASPGRGVCIGKKINFCKSTTSPTLKSKRGDGSNDNFLIVR